MLTKYLILQEKVKNLNDLDKIKIIKSLWRIIYSNKDADIYETNLMRRLAGLLILTVKLWEILKNKLKKKFPNDIHCK